MVKLIQLGEGDARGASCHPCKANELESVNERGQDTAVRPPKKQNGRNAEISCRQTANCGTEQGGQRTQADSEANLPDGTDKVSQRMSVPFPLKETVCTPPAKGGKPLLLPVYPSIAPCAALLQIQ